MRVGLAAEVRWAVPLQVGGLSGQLTDRLPKKPAVVAVGGRGGWVHGRLWCLAVRVGVRVGACVTVCDGYGHTCEQHHAEKRSSRPGSILDGPTRSLTRRRFLTGTLASHGLRRAVVAVQTYAQVEARVMPDKYSLGWRCQTTGTVLLPPFFYLCAEWAGGGGSLGGSEP